MTSALASPFRSLAIRNFRLFAAGQVVSVTGTWMMITAQDWLVLSLTDGSGSALGLVTALQFTPMLLLTLYGGRLADRYDKRVLLLGANLTAGVLALLLALLTLTGTVRLGHLCFFALCLGTVNAVETPTRISFVSELVGPALLPNASALSVSYFSVSRVVGPAASGALIAWLGTGPVMLVNAVSYVAPVAGLLLMRPGELLRGAPGRGPHRVVDALRHVASRRDLTLPLALVAAVGLFGLNFQVTLPLIARTVFDADARTFGLLTTALAAGSLLAALAGTARRERPSGRLVAGSALGFGVLETVAGWAPTLGLAMVALFLTGLASTYFAQAANHRIQLGSDPAYRGRVMALYTLILQGTTPLGSLLVGGLAGVLGARSGLWLGGLATTGAALLCLATERRTRTRSDDRPPD
ncbi:MFS transporter [Streptomyces roseirectus]|uniref:MFS transporter n=1 Tax=Streptomyces roseirectus TaxID=2768066 RepID=A0A7H0IP37_9ACTN|nr:MFS transporter [Streptomyces roseirectus]QNP74553.1 MFS transporter [Streptomyces roseirectus]